MPAFATAQRRQSLGCLSWACPLQAKNKQKQETKAPRAKEVKKKAKVSLRGTRPGAGDGAAPPTRPGICAQAKEKKGKAEKGKERARPKERKGKGPRKTDKGLLAQRRLEERRRQQLILEEMKKPTEDMCLGDHQVGWGRGGAGLCPAR